jgi:hypothetical protein
MPGANSPSGKSKADGVDVGVPPVVDNDVVPRLLRHLGKVGMHDQRPVGLPAQETVFRRIHDQQAPVGEEVDAHQRRDGHDHLMTTAGIERDHLTGAPVREP